MHALVCTGGGAVGAYQAGVIKYIHENFCVEGRSPFQLFAGVSCGSLNATFLAIYSQSAQEKTAFLEKLWRDFHVPEYHADLLASLFRSVFRRSLTRDEGRRWSLLDPKPLQQVIARGYDGRQLAEAYASGSTQGLAIATTEIVTGYPVWFVDGPQAQPWDRPYALALQERIGPKHVAASCSVPILLSPVRIGKHFYLDGSINLTRPLSPVLAMGATKILAIRTDIVRKHRLPVYRRGFKPNWQKVSHLLFNAIARDFTFAEMGRIDMVNRLLEQSEGFELASESRSRPYRKIETLSLSPSERPSDLFHTFRQRQDSLGERTRHEHMFHRDYIGMLIDLGYRDAKARDHDLRCFFADSGSSNQPAQAG